MELLITDNLKHYELAKHTHKVLIKDWKIHICSFFNEAEIQKINMNFLAIEMVAAKATQNELLETLTLLENKKFNANTALKTRLNFDINYSLLQINFWEFVIKKHVVKIISKKIIDLIKVQKITFFLQEDYILCRDLIFNEFDASAVRFKFYNTSGILLKKLTERVKNLFYWHAFNLKKITKLRSPKAIKKQHILLLLFDIPSMHVVLNTFINLIKETPSIQLTIIEISSGIDKKLSCSAKKHQAANIQVRKYSEFRSPNFISHQDFYRELKHINVNYKIFKKYNLLSNLENHYAWMNSVFEEVNPSVAFMMGTTNISRVFSDTARLHKTPSVNLQYGMIADDPYGDDYNIAFNTRALIGKEASDIWRKNGDASPTHEVIGFCKLDELKNYSFNKDLFFETHHFNKNTKTILFASSWANSNKNYEIEKEEIINELSKLCHKKSWNFILKKHPSEIDDIAERVIKQNNFSFQKVFKHTNLSLYDAISAADFVTCLPSSTIYEVLCLKKPFCFITKKSENSLISYFNIFKEKEVKTFIAIKDTEDYIEESFNTTINSVFYEELIEKYLYKNDGNASKRLLDLLLKLKY